MVKVSTGLAGLDEILFGGLIPQKHTYCKASRFRKINT